jgi:hypothetical protein
MNSNLDSQAMPKPTGTTFDLSQIINHELPSAEASKRYLTYANLLKKEGFCFLRLGKRQMSAACFLLAAEVFMQAIAHDESIISSVTPALLQLNDLLLSL